MRLAKKRNAVAIVANMGNTTETANTDEVIGEGCPIVSLDLTSLTCNPVK